jgi:hypothetical protein
LREGDSAESPAANPNHKKKRNARKKSSAGSHGCAAGVHRGGAVGCATGEHLPSR